MSDAVKSSSVKSHSRPTRNAVSRGANPRAGASGSTQARGTGAPNPVDRVDKAKKEPPVSEATSTFIQNLQNSYNISGPTAGDRVIADARSHLGEKTQDVQAPNYVATGGNTNNCANFASTMLHNQGQLSGREQSVAELEKMAQKEGWRSVSQEDARPGDLAFREDVSHVELVATDHATRTIGSNNENPDSPGIIVHGQQWITERPTEGKEFRFYTNRPAEEQ